MLHLERFERDDPLGLVEIEILPSGFLNRARPDEGRGKKAQRIADEISGISRVDLAQEIAETGLVDDRAAMPDLVLEIAVPEIDISERRGPVQITANLGERDDLARRAMQAISACRRDLLQ